MPFFQIYSSISTNFEYNGCVYDEIFLVIWVTHRSGLVGQQKCGPEPETIKLVDKCDELEVAMILENTHDFITVKKADRLRMKRFKKLPELHKEAFEKGIFKTDKACYTQEFIPYYKKKLK
jgi:hypothetical protein